MSQNYPNIIAIDDEECLLEAYEMALSSTKVNLITSSDSAQGIELIVKHNPIVVFVDLKMPNLSGTQVVKKIHELGISTKIYIVSAYIEEFMPELEDMKRRGIEYEIAVKPLYPKEIRQIVTSYISIENSEPKAEEKSTSKTQDIELMCNSLTFTILGLLDKVDEFEAKLQKVASSSNIQRIKTTKIRANYLPEKNPYRDIFNSAHLEAHIEKPLIKLIEEAYTRDDIILVVQVNSKFNIVV
ncbi:response regulator [Shewanella sp. WXL01]|uniref:response regulator n=1 Tax=Shewanella sp. WXL01 TaxID=2709721 RepID=UPI0014383423|nr:response regulator [Shewanella sp. WXL01]NKF50367.1 response regulator [Shewanella sp. WXL01]